MIIHFWKLSIRFVFFEFFSNSIFATIFYPKFCTSKFIVLFGRWKELDCGSESFHEIARFSIQVLWAINIIVASWKWFAKMVVNHSVFQIVCFFASNVVQLVWIVLNGKIISTAKMDRHISSFQNILQISMNIFVMYLVQGFFTIFGYSSKFGNNASETVSMICIMRKDSLNFFSASEF